MENNDGSYPRISAALVDTDEGARKMARAFETVGCFVIEGRSQDSIVEAGLSAWRRFKALPAEVKITYHHSVKRGVAKGAWLPMREAPVYMSHMDDQELTASDPKQQFGCGVETSTTVWPEEIDCPVHAYGLLENHILALCTPQSADGVSKMMQAIGRRYAYAFNQTHQRTGALWDGRYKACLMVQLSRSCCTRNQPSR